MPTRQSMDTTHCSICSDAAVLTAVKELQRTVQYDGDRMATRGVYHNMDRVKYLEYMAHRDDVLARLERRKGNGAMQALWEIYAKQKRAEIKILKGARND